MSNWNTLAELDPLWAVLSNPRKKFGEWDPAEVFSKGEREAERVIGLGKSLFGDVKMLGEFAAHAHGLRTLTREKKCDFRCHSREDCIACSRMQSYRRDMPQQPQREMFLMNIKLAPAFL